MDLGQWIVIGLSALMGVWYGVASFYNRRRGVATYYWLRDGLNSQGKISEAAWIGSSGSGARLVVGKAGAPFKRIEVVFLLESREILPLWLFNRFRRKLDEMILKADLRSMPSQEIEVTRSSERITLELMTGAQASRSEQTEAPAGLTITLRGGKDEDMLRRLSDFLDRYGTAIKRISLQKKSPHLMVHAELPVLRVGEAENFLAALSEIFA